MAIKRKFPPRVATVYCSGGCRAKKDEDGALLCAYGCIGCEACVNACRFDAIHLNEFGCAEVDDEKCIGCGLCVKNCPADAIHIEQFHAVIDAARCLSCGACAVVCPHHVIKDRLGVLTPVH